MNFCWPVRHNLAHSSDFAADDEVNAENNRVVTETEFQPRLAELTASIEESSGHGILSRTFGASHALRRSGMLGVTVNPSD
jgi:hypothetical protein